MLLFFDTEATGLPDFKARSSAKHQPHLVQLAALLCDFDGTDLASMNFIIKPDGWEIPDAIARIHGISTEKAHAFGVDCRLVLALFDQMGLVANQWIAHNASFDLKVMKIQCRKHSFPWLIEEIQKDKIDHAVEVLDTCKMAKPIVKLPATAKMKAAGFGGYKNPNLSECVDFFLGQKLEGAHDAMVDVWACKDIYFAMRDWQEQDEAS